MSAIIIRYAIVIQLRAFLAKPPQKFAVQLNSQIAIPGNVAFDAAHGRCRARFVVG